MKKAHSSNIIRAFFARSDYLDRMTLRPLSHITLSWEVQWDLESEKYEPEYDSFADDLNVVIEQLANCARPASYHSHEDQLAENTLRLLKWPIQKKKGRWIGADYAAILEQGAFGEMSTLISAACGRVHAAIDHGQAHFDEMEDGHLVMLAALITIIIYHRDCNGTSLRLALPDPNALDGAVVAS
ncbi:hypothetical protein RFN28_25770 [Mesorhizobium sp. VK24D]|uniref:Uncharacterized protein n=1 Tax=Mesorhizobium album TaxID=3072314 RepID=A0ABU4Y4H5_9HYPH|nr:hypothetical protein [Mesorhizobium sp. VK24D]MDX8481845.1 hypothetical protein [Mesorhizobium sp. VK24D]